MSILTTRERIRVIPVLFAAALLFVGCSAYGGQTIGKEGSGQRQVQTDGEHCMVTLPEGWTWYPASWTATSPWGAQMTFQEALYGRPEYPEWEEARNTAIAEVRKRVSDAEIIEGDNFVRVDYGSSGGLAVLRKFDRVGCQLTFSRGDGNREQEITQWEQIIDSLVRTSPTENFTPTP